MPGIRTVVGVVACVLLSLSVCETASARVIEQATPDPSNVIVLDRAVDAGTRKAVSAALDMPLGATGTVTILRQPDGRLQRLDGDGEVVASTSGGWGKAWRVAKCTAAVGGFIAGNALLVLKVRKLGGVAAVARRLVAAGSAEARWKAAAAFFGDVTGLGGVVAACG